MNSQKKFYFYFGTTAEYIKLAPIIKEFNDRKIKYRIVTSGQNEIHFDELQSWLGKIQPDIKINQKVLKSSIFLFGVWALKSLFKSFIVLNKELANLSKKNTYLIIHGDTISSLLGALIGKLLRVKVVHVESGLRSFDFFEPFPEEIARYIVSKLADIHFCPNEWALNNLVENSGKKINTKQNTLIESTFSALKLNKNSYAPDVLDIQKYFLFIMHRQEKMFNKKGAENVIKSVFLNMNKDLTCVVVMHHFTRKLINDEISSKIEKENNVIFLPRLPYAKFINLVDKSEFIITDGGSNQEEAFYLGKPCLLIRNRTERIEGLGSNVLLSKNKDNFISKFMKNPNRYKKNIIKIQEKPSKIILDFLLNDEKV